MRSNPGLRDAVAGSGMILADGQSVVWASRMLQAPLPERVTGIDLFQELLAEAAQRGYRVYFLGARPDVLSRMLAEAGRRFPGLTVAGARDGYYASGEEAEIAAEIRRSGADLLFLGMSSPRKELFTSRGARPPGRGSFMASAGRLTFWPGSPGAHRFGTSGTAWSGSIARSRSRSGSVAGICGPICPS